MSDDFTHYAQTCRERVDRALDACLLDITEDNPLLSAMRYALLNGGKRVRPLLVYAAARALGRSADATVDQAACALEAIHAYSLVHDDLPAMDDDDLRRGQPTCHIRFGEATAILTGDALQTLAFELLTTLPATAATARLQALRTLTQASGAQGMVLGQAIDLAAVDKTLDLAQLERMHQHKTGALIRASVTIGGLLGDADATQLQALDDYADAIGLAFQVQDDILDVTTETAVLGKQQGADVARNKPTYVALLGLEGARTKADELRDRALNSLRPFDDRADALRQLAQYIVDRGN
ncbi:(2E,6E)-farnesyl diphosphate synthase [Marinimicrobium alkaliphilum]|uniref:(2E,6E)-farnesyl diphosphate synthase n=1 Tax=Marinimicrobium alkaliphilum TaxID=2202654 RepID=UPI000DB947B4|nr:farnesyl diphosphate synthase [Marinimicrobium alkaliphilum]